MIMLLFGSVSNHWIMKKIDTSAPAQIYTYVIIVASKLSDLYTAEGTDLLAVLASISTESENLADMNTFCENINNDVKITTGGIRTLCTVSTDQCTLYGTEGDANAEANGPKKKTASDMLAAAITLLCIGFGVAAIFLFWSPPFLLLRGIPVVLMIIASVISLIGMLIAKNALSASSGQTTSFADAMEGFQEFTVALYAAEESVGDDSFTPASTNIPACEQTFIGVEEVPALSDLAGMDSGGVITIFGTLFCFLGTLFFVLSGVLEWRKFGFGKGSQVTDVFDFEE
jgi:hypothetical protein